MRHYGIHYNDIKNFNAVKNFIIHLHMIKFILTLHIVTIYMISKMT